MTINKAKPTKRIDQYIVNCITVEGFHTSDYSLIPMGFFVFVFYDEKDYNYRAIRPFNDDDLLPFFDEQNKAPIGYGFVVGNGRVALTLFDGQELKDDAD